MSILNAIGEGSLNELLARRLNTPGGATAPGVAPELFPSLTLENDRPEWGYLKQEQYGTVSRQRGATAAEYGVLWMSNPFAPNLLTIEEIQVTSTSDMIVGVGVYPGFSATSTIGNGFNRDARFQRSNQVVFEIGTSAVVPTLDRLFARLAPGLAFNVPIILPPNNNYGLLVYTASTNVVFNANVQYRIRGAQPGELR